MKTVFAKSYSADAFDDSIGDDFDADVSKILDDEDGYEMGSALDDMEVLQDFKIDDDY